MTISSQLTVHRYVGDGIQNAWPVLFTFLKPEHVKAVKTSVEGVDTSLMYGSDYAVEVVDGGGGRCTAPLAKDEKITLFLDVPLTQETDLRNAGKLSAEVIERMSDKLTLALQQQRDDIKRCVQVPPSSDSNPQQVMKDLNESAAIAKSAKDDLITIKQETLELKQESAVEAEKAKTVVSDAVKLVSDAQKLITSAQALIKEGMGGSSAPAVDELLSGMVLPFKGTVNSDGYPVNRMTGQADTKYALCDGRTYTAPDGVGVTTPDLRDKFIAGAGNKYAQGATGGADTVKLTITEMPAHSHLIRAHDSGGSYTFDDLMASNRTTTAERSTSQTGGSQAHENRPPYYALAYMMKL
ncbi:hypothetical protein [Halodesulfovibrio sp.]|jgi:hypothetical protein|uniref:hypothetical protein n=1 Tax=Halodesulfovibrio sp. TaxID=1912772 RepID=UPI0025E979A4|nr:hypothetical protein [Halodesulfovibrio sp.]MCT4534542.1 hypothetical protein [Halodesulfovibrio sp.]